MTELPADERLLLLAQEADEVPLLSALTQSAILRAPDVAWDRRGRRVVLMLNRYRWEANQGTRVRSALRIENVLSVQRRHWPDANAHDPGITILELLAFTLDDLTCTLTFAAGASLRLRLECVDMVLEDISGPWAAAGVPTHDN